MLVTEFGAFGAVLVLEVDDDAGGGAGIIPSLSGSTYSGNRDVTSISASLLYNHLQCPHRVFMDVFADPAHRDPVSPFVQLLWERGTLYETDVIARLGVPFTDLSTLTGEAKEAATREAIARGDALIYNGRLTVDELLGEPDLLRQEGAGYAAIDIKSGSGEEGGDADAGEDGKPKKTYGVQIALYTDLLERLGVSAGRFGYIWDVHGEELRYDLDTPLGPKSSVDCGNLSRCTGRGGTGTLAQGQKTLPARTSVCKQCVWGSICLRDMKGAGDLSLLPQLGRAKRDVLMPVLPPWPSWRARANLSRYAAAKKSPFPGVSVSALSKLQVPAQLAVDPNSVPFFREAVALPTNPLEVFFHIEKMIRCGMWCICTGSFGTSKPGILIASSSCRYLPKSPLSRASGVRLRPPGSS